MRGLECYQHCYLYSIRSPCITWCTLSTFIPWDLTVSDLNFENPQPKFGNFVSLRSSFIKATAKFHENSLFLKVCHFTGLQQLQRALNINTHKTQHSFTVMLTTRHSRSLGSHLVSLRTFNLLVFLWNEIINFNSCNAVYRFWILTVVMWLDFSELHC